MTSWLDPIRKKKGLISKLNPHDAEDPGAPKVRVVFMGTPKLSASLLLSLLENGYNIVGVVTKPDKPQGRKQEEAESEVKKIALAHNVPLLQPEKLDGDAVAALHDWKPDLIFVAAFGKILPKSVLDIPGFGCINFHTSLLPAWRGASPIQNALLAGAKETGVTLILMDEGMDTGDILAQKSVPILENDTRELLTEKLLVSGNELLLETLPLWIKRKITPKKQDNSKATLCQLIEREDGHIIWTDEAESIYNRYRALMPWPGIFTFWKKDDELLRLKLIRISYQKQNPQISHNIGEVFEVGEKIAVQTGTGLVFLEEVQLEGKNAVSIQDFIRGNALLVGSYLQ